MAHSRKSLPISSDFSVTVDQIVAVNNLIVSFILVPVKLFMDEEVCLTLHVDFLILEIN